MPKRATAGAAPPATVPRRRNVREEIYNAALAAFERHGVRRTLMEDVAQAAGVSRPTIYYYFPDKDALVLEVIAREVREIHRRIRERVPADGGLPAMIEASMTTIRLSGENQYIQLLTQPDTAGLTARLAESDIIMGLQRELWYPLLEAARDRGELRTDRDFDDIIRWITFLEFSLISSGDLFGFAGEEECRDVLSAYLVPALLPR
ncbi:MAG TPA: helix-turn-helix domain-containing protein [Acidimicrobiia bacterium]|nr:helix-turn-helix domain-containing protein [Acidimicrobiia bacterium]